MRFAFVILFLMLSGAASAADIQTPGTAEAERQAAAEAERTAKEAADAKSAESAPQPNLMATTAALSPASPEALAACGRAEIADIAAADAIAARAKGDADAHAATPAQLAVIGPESAATLAASHSLAPAVAGHAYFAGVCARLLEQGAPPESVQPVLAELARKLGVAYPATAAANESAATGNAPSAAPAGPDAAVLAQQEAERAAKEAAERTAKEAAEREAAERAAKGTAEREAAQRAAQEAAERTAREAAEREAAERATRETAEREAAERVARETAERDAAEKAAKEETAGGSALGNGATPPQRTAVAEAPSAAPVDTAPPPPAAAPPSDAPIAAPPAMQAAPESPVAAAPPAPATAPPAAPELVAPSAPAPAAEPAAPSAPAPAAPASAPAASLEEARPAPPPAATPGADGMLGEAECRAVGVLGKCPDLNSVLARLLEKPLEYNHPKEMLLGKATEISLVLRTDWEGKDLPTEVSEELKGLPGEVKQGLSKITRVMSAELSGRNFEVSPAGRQERTVSPPQQVAWNWQVKPSETGPSQPLKLRLYAHLQGPDGTMPPLLVKTLDATINVDVTTWDWIVNQARTLEPIYAVGAALIGLMTALMTFLLSRRRREMYEGAGGDLYRADNEPTTTNGPVIGDLNQSAADSRVTSPPPAPAAPSVAAPPSPPEEKKDKPSGTIPVDPDGGIEPKKD